MMKMQIITRRRMGQAKNCLIYQTCNSVSEHLDLRRGCTSLKQNTRSESGVCLTKKTRKCFGNYLLEPQKIESGKTKFGSKTYRRRRSVAQHIRPRLIRDLEAGS